MAKCGIYCIGSRIDGKRYVGKSIGISKRMADHFKMLRINKHSNRHLQSSYNINGRSNFYYEVLELCDADKLDARETFHINELNALDERYGFNLKIEAGDFTIHSQETIEYMRAKKIGKPVNGYSKGGALIKSWTSISACAKDLKVNPCDIRRTISQIQLTCKGYVMRFGDFGGLREYGYIGRTRNELGRYAVERKPFITE